MLPADMVGGVSADRAANLEVSRVLLKDFQKRVADVLTDLESSAANPNRVSEQRIPAGALHSGHGGFAEADELFGQYERVHSRLTSLTRALGLQIEATGIAVQGARRGFENLEEEQRRRFREIQTELSGEQERAQQEHEQWLRHQQSHGEQGPARTNDTRSGTGYR